MEVGEVAELGTTKDHQEVQSTWTSEDDTKAYVLNGVVLAKDVGSVNINAQYSGESSSCAITVNPNSTDTKFKVLDMTVASVGYQLEFLANGSPVPFNTLTIHQTVEGVVSIDNSNGQVTPLKNGHDIIVAIYNGKKYGHHVEVSGLSTLSEEPKPRTRARKTK